MKVASVASATMFAAGVVADATDLVASDAAVGDESGAAAAGDGSDGSGRALQSSSCVTTEKWHPQYNKGWAKGYCRLTKDCNSPGYATNLACCNGAYKDQYGGYCYSKMPNPPTSSPTDSGGLDVWYPDYNKPWNDAYCINVRPLPNGRPTYATMLACCKGAYSGQLSGECFSRLPAPPTSSPTGSGGLDVWYPDYDTDWSNAYCINEGPLPNGRPTYKSMLECCKGAYGGQSTGKCLSMLPAPPTSSPTGSGGLDVWYPDYGTDWSSAYCINDGPLPNGRPTYDSMLACCKGAYGSQASGKCLSMLPAPPSASPTESGGLDVWYPNYADWSVGKCINDGPVPNGRLTYDSKGACCSGAYATQNNDYCRCDIDSCYSCKCSGDLSGCSNLDCD